MTESRKQAMKKELASKGLSIRRKPEAVLLEARQINATKELIRKAA